ncbi:MAG: fasciclin domain-containing protein [Janthinobacterium lividum]
MNKHIQQLFLLFSFLLLITSCRKQAFDDFYGRPDNLAPAIYQQLQAKGNFTSLLTCIDKAGYKNTLSNAGYWTMFAPNDDAFKQYFTDNNITGIAQVDSVAARKIVTYSLVYNAFQTDHIADFQNTTLGWVANSAFKRRTTYYDDVYANANSPTGNSLSSNRNGPLYTFGDNNNKYIPYFYSTFFAARNLTATDYNYFYPKITYTGFNVAGGAVVNKNVVAENGVIHEVNRVTLPLPSLEQYLSSNANYSVFQQLYEKYMVSYTINSDATHRYQVLTGSTGQVAIKQYNPLLGYSLNNENYLKLQDNDGQSDGYSLFVPNNTVLNNYLNTVILENYKTIDKLPTSIITDLLNAHMWQTTVWPSKFSTTSNVQGEPARFDANVDVTDKMICSNGFFYGTNKVQLANVFNSVYARPYLDPNYTLMTRALDLGLKYIIINPSVKVTLFMMSDAFLRSLGYDYSSALSSFTYTAPGTTTVVSGSIAQGRILRLLYLHTVLTPNGELNNLGGPGITETYGGEYIRYQDNVVYAAGNQEYNQIPKVASVKNTTNGPVYYLNTSVLQVSEKNVGYHLLLNGAKATDAYGMFYQYLLNSPLYISTAVGGGTITGIQPGVFYTMFIPTNAAIQTAINQGDLPGTGTGTVKVPNYNPTAQTDKDLVSRFILYHILNKTTVVPDGKKPGTYSTLLSTSTGDAATFNVASTAGTLRITDANGRISNLIPGNYSNVLSNYIVIHQIDNYLKYKY